MTLLINSLKVYTPFEGSFIRGTQAYIREKGFSAHLERHLEEELPFLVEDLLHLWGNLKVPLSHLVNGIGSPRTHIGGECLGCLSTLEAFGGQI